MLWAASVCLAMVTWAVIAAHGWHWQSDGVMLFASVLAAAQAAVLWWRAPSILLHIATFATLAMGVGAAGDRLAVPPASSAAIWLWVFAACWVVLGLLGWVSPRLTALLLGSGLAVVASQTTADSHWGSVFALLTAAAVTAFAVSQRSIALLAVGAYAVLTSVPTLMNQFFPGSASIALGLLLAGLVLIGSALLILRRDAGHGETVCVTHLAISDLGTILSVWAHRDDEGYCCGGIMAAAVATGQRVVCVTATRGELGSTDESRWPNGPELAAVRTQELAAALAILGVTEHHWLDYPDGGCHEVDESEAVGRLRALIDEVQPDTILTFGPDGGTWHSDHIAVSSWASAAAEGTAVRVLEEANTPEREEAVNKIVDPLTGHDGRPAPGGLRSPSARSTCAARATARPEVPRHALHGEPDRPVDVRGRAGGVPHHAGRGSVHRRPPVGQVSTTCSSTNSPMAG